MLQMLSRERMEGARAGTGVCWVGFLLDWHHQKERNLRFIRADHARGMWGLYLGEEDAEGGGEGEEADDEPDGAGMAGDVHWRGRGMRFTLVVVRAVLAQQEPTQGTCGGICHAENLWDRQLRVPLACKPAAAHHASTTCHTVTFGSTWKNTGKVHAQAQDLIVRQSIQ